MTELYINTDGHPSKGLDRLEISSSEFDVLVKKTNSYHCKDGGPINLFCKFPSTKQSVHVACCRQFQSFNDMLIWLIENKGIVLYKIYDTPNGFIVRYYDGVKFNWITKLWHSFWSFWI
jgi:hypothetical protein